VFDVAAANCSLPCVLTNEFVSGSR
jgi:hypothetical protein